MARVDVVSDTTACLSPELVDEHGIRIVSLYVNFGPDRTEREADIADLEAFYGGLRSAEQLPTTSQPAVGDFIAVYEPLLAEGRDIVSLHLSAALSGTCDAARQAAQQLERDGKGGERIHVIDSGTGAGGLGLLTLAAAHAANAGEDADAVVEGVHAANADLDVWFALDTLEYLRRGGRIGPASAWIGSTLKIKPILSVSSELKPVERVRTSGRAFERLVDYARKLHDRGCDAWVVQHIASEDQAERLTDRCREVFGTDPVWVSEISAVLGVHLGPGLLGVGGMPSRYLR
jgi:DegV family protein with EDD domain